MTRKDYNAAAALCRARHAGKETVDILSTIFANDNPSFDEVKFRAACSPEKAKSKYYPKPV
jgi:hypothetical protein